MSLYSGHLHEFSPTKAGFQSDNETNETGGEDSRSVIQIFCAIFLCLFFFPCFFLGLEDAFVTIIGSPIISGIVVGSSWTGCASNSELSSTGSFVVGNSWTGCASHSELSSI
mmetsp:Transcript_13672/g.24518  ORF Transcript_13672/g.24518 Transcript_13672/m.24518 type:complete len:112 (+) Transcript_13672:141-476(+)